MLRNKLLLSKFTNSLNNGQRVFHTHQRVDTQAHAQKIISKKKAQGDHVQHLIWPE